MTDETNTTGRWTVDEDGDLVFLNPGHLSHRDNIINRNVQVRDGAILSPASFDALVALVRAAESAPTAPADDLPPGVERISDGTYICRGIDIPEGWGFYGPAESIDASEDESRPWWDWRDRETDVRTGDVYYQVRPITPAEPATEWVPWWEALRDARKVRASNVAWITCTEMRTVDGVPWVGKQAVGWAAARADGKVEVQR